MNGSAEYRTATAFRRAVEDRLKKESKARGRALQQLRREFLFQRFLALVFADPCPAWVLKGGAGLLMRMPDARFSRDLDLLRLGALDPAVAIAELRRLAAPRAGDHLTFVIDEGVRTRIASRVVQLTVTAYAGAVYDTFSIDLSTDLRPVSTLERVSPVPVVEVPGLPGPPEITVYPLADQVADKVCAMYELHGSPGRPSTRYRDLVDLVLIVTTTEVDAERTAAALAAERRRRALDLPAAMMVPSRTWPAGYAAEAGRAGLRAELHRIDAGLAVVAACLDPILAGTRAAGIWMPSAGWSADA